VVHLRDWRSDDLDWWVALRLSWYPEMGSEEYLRATASDPLAPWITRRVAEEDGRRLGAVTMRESPGGMDMPSSVILVEPALRGMGIGKLLWREACLAAPGSRLYMALPDRDVKSLGVLQHWGFDVVQHGIEMAIDLTVADRNPAVQRDISVTVIHDSELDASGIDVDSVLLEAVDSPEARELGWVVGKEDLRAMGDDLWWVAARQGEQVVAVSVAAAEGDTWQLLITEVLSTYRRRGVARMVKAHLHAAAVGAGARQMLTQSEEGNTAVLHLNETLGYEVIGGEYRLVHPGLPLPGDDAVPEVTRPVP
jgi:GNAT superfamily N-acetyltransferase